MTWIGEATTTEYRAIYELAISIFYIKKDQFVNRIDDATHNLQEGVF